MEGIALVAGVDRIADMFRTTLNTVDYMAVTAAVANWEDGLNRKIFYGEEQYVAPEEGGAPALAS